MKTGIIHSVSVGYMYIKKGVVIREGRERELKCRRLRPVGG